MSRFGLEEITNHILMIHLIVVLLIVFGLRFFVRGSSVFFPWSRFAAFGLIRPAEFGMLGLFGPFLSFGSLFVWLQS